MAGLDIGTLTGQIAIEDQFSSTFDLIIRKSEQFVDDFDGALGKLAVGAGLVSAAILGITAAVTALAVKGNDVTDITDTFTNFADRAGGAEASLSSFRTGVRGTVDDLALMKEGSNLLAANVKMTADDFGTLGQAAMVLNSRGLGPTEQMLKDVTRALVSGQTTQLARKLGVIDSTDAERRYAEALGLSVSQLTPAMAADAKRAGVMEMLRSAIDAAGDSQNDFGDKLDIGMAKLANWTNELARTVGASPKVVGALDAIGDALSETGDSADLMRTIVGWVERFTDVVTEYGPVVIHTLSDIASTIKSIWTTVMDAWDAVPDWMKEVLKASAVAAAGVYAVDKATNVYMKTLGYLDDAAGGFLGTSNETIQVYGKLPAVLGAATVKLSAMRGVVQEVAEHWRLMTPAMGGVMESLPTLAGSLASYAVIAASAVAVGTALWQGWKLYSENAERAAAASRQAGFDASNLAILNQKLGTSYTDVNEASQEWIRRNKDAKPAVDEHSAAVERNNALLREHEIAVTAIINSARKAAQDIDVERDAFKKLGDMVLFNVETQNMFTAAMDKLAASGRALTEAEKIRYDFIVQDRLALVDYGTEMLKKQKVTIEAIETAKALGKSENEIARSFGVSTDALSTYTSEMATLRDLREEVADKELRVSGRTAQAVEEDREREFQASLRSFRGSSAEFDAYYNLRRRQMDADRALEHMSSTESISDAKAQADNALKEYNRMIASGNYFREDLEAQREEYYRLRDAASAWGHGAAEAANEATTAMREHNRELEYANALADQAFNNQKIRESGKLYTIDAAGNYKLQDSITETFTGRVQPRGEVNDRNVDETLREIARLSKEISEYNAPRAQDRQFFDERTYYMALRAEKDAIQRHEDAKAQLRYLEQLVNAFQGGSSASRGSRSSGAPVAVWADSPRGVPAAMMSPAARGLGEAPSAVYNNTFHVNGTAQDTARQIGGIFIKQLKARRYLPTGGG